MDQDLFVLLYDVARMMRTRADQLARQHGMTRAQWIILKRLAQTPGLSQRELAELAEVEPITVARLIDRLEERGLVERRADAADRRIWRLHVTEAAQPMLAVIDQLRATLRDDMAGGMDAALLTEMEAGLRQMKANLAGTDDTNRRETA